MNCLVTKNQIFGVTNYFVEHLTIRNKRWIFEALNIKNVIVMQH